MCLPGKPEVVSLIPGTKKIKNKQQKNVTVVHDPRLKAGSPPGLSTPSSGPVLELLLPVSPKQCSQPSWFSCFPPGQNSEPEEVTERSRHLPAHSHPLPKPCCSVGFSRGFSLPGSSTRSKPPFQGLQGGASDERGRRCGLVPVNQGRRQESGASRPLNLLRHPCS